MDKRLSCIRSHIPDSSGLIDIGTDHGYLPVALALSGYSGRLFASDLREGPLQAAFRSAENAGCSERIEFLLCDGLDRCDPRAVDTIVIAGMGGDTICGILDRAEWCMQERYLLVLQPMTHAEVLRYWLVYNGFGILEEDLVEDKGILYTVFTARFGGVTKLSDAELFTGSFRMLKEHRLFPRLIDKEQMRFRKKLNGLEAGKQEDHKAERQLLRLLLQELKEMKDRAAG